MRAVGRLIWTYFTATPLMKGLSGIGIVLFTAGLYWYSHLTQSQMMQVMRGAGSFVEFLPMSMPFFGMICMLGSTIMLPSIAERIALGRSVWVLPGGRVSLLVSVVVTAAILAVIVAFEANTLFFGFGSVWYRSEVFYRTLLMAFIDLGFIFTAIWLVGKTSGIWRLMGVLVVIISITLPLRYIGRIPPLSPFEGLGVLGWVVFGVVLLAGGRIRHAHGGIKVWFTRALKKLAPTSDYVGGNELDLLLGTAAPWIVALGQTVPIAVMAVLIPESRVWPAVMIIFSAMAGAITSQAASRCHRLWLRFDWDRATLVRRIEGAFWRYNSKSLGVLLVLYVALGLYAEYPTVLIFHGLFLLTIGCAACTYLGLMITRGLGWFESCLCILTLIVLDVAAIVTMRDSYDIVLQLEAVLVVLTIAFRYMALSRWVELDWMRCRPEIQARGVG